MFFDGARILADGARTISMVHGFWHDGAWKFFDGARILADGARKFFDGARILADGARVPVQWCTDTGDSWGEGCRRVSMKMDYFRK